MNKCDPISAEDTAALFGPWLRPLPRCALAVSGGSDSAALMVLFAEWLRQAGEGPGRHCVLTVDHGLRPEAAAEARTVGALAGALGFQHAVLQWEGSKPETGIQAAARAARYRLMYNHMQANALALLLTGHTRDDRAETLLMRLARGSGLDGLAGIAPRLSFRDLGISEATPGEPEPEILRPLLDISRSRLRAFLKARGIGWSDDPTNLSLDFERPRLRAARAELDALGLTDPMLALTAGRLLRARRAVEKAVDKFCSAGEGAVTVHPSGFLNLDRVMLQAAGEEIALRALGRAIAAAGGSDEPPSLGKLEIIAAGVLTPEPADATWTLGRALITARSAVLTVEREPGREPFPVLELTPGAQATWDRRFHVSAGPAMNGPVEVRALGEVVAREVRQQAQTTTETTAQVPLSVARFVPGFWRGKSLLAAPSVDFWSEPGLREVLQSRFLGLESIPRSAGEILK